MKPRIRKLILVSTFALAGAAATAIAAITAGTTSKISVSSSGGIASGFSGNPKQPVNGGYIVYDTGAPDVLSGDTNFSTDVVLNNLTTGDVSAVSVNQAGVLGDSTSQNPSISAVGLDGFFGVAFESDASNLNSLFSDLNDFQDIYVRLPTLNKTFLLTFGTDTQTGTRLSADGRSHNPSIALAEATNELVVAFSTDAENLRAGDTNGVRDIRIAVVNLAALASAPDPSDTISFESIDAGPGLPQPNRDSDQPSISGDGRYIAFVSLATNLVSGSTSSFPQIYLFDRKTKAVTLVSKSKTGIPGDGASSAPSVNFNGRYIAYLTQADNLGGVSATQLNAIARYDTQTGETTRVDTLPTGEIANNAAQDCSISATGRLVTFSTLATNLAAGDLNDIPDIYVRDMATGAVTRVGLAANGTPADGHNSRGTLSGRSFNSLSVTLSFISDATNLVANDSFLQDVFVSPVSLSAPPLSSGTKIEVPPDVLISGTSKKKTIRLTLQEFDLSAGTAGLLSDTAQARRSEVVYDVRLERKGRKRDNQSKLSKRNQVAFRKVAKGSYTARYRAMVKRGTKIISRTPFSPRRPIKTQ